ncbi:putative eka-like protein [Erysiphe necator]|uniref:Putative eka-like protein n=1 Tax=Uncinula necator TaxID=52586 RepID=A0A0B1PJ02_UNCNE|nr:putative eka-like protein [Erysiphe necator]
MELLSISRDGWETSSQSITNRAQHVTPPSSTTPPTSVVENRKIIKPVLPSKRAAQNAAVIDLTNDKNNRTSSHAYLPQELTNIVLARQRQERAWHIRLSICTCILSNVESTFSIYKEDIEKEEANVIRKYLQKAIAHLVASDNAPQPPEIPIESKPSKMKSSNLPRNSKIIDSHVLMWLTQKHPLFLRKITTLISRDKSLVRNKKKIRG